jgi:glycosyltransferase involved in cell wall biosynthesis
MVINIAAYIQPQRTIVPSSGVGRHANELLLRLNKKAGINLHLLASNKWKGTTDRLNIDSPLQEVPTHWVHADLEKMERRWKLFGSPALDRFVPRGTDWVYCPMETFVRFRGGRVAITVHDVHPFETDLPGARTPRGLIQRARWGFWFSGALSVSNVILTVSQFTKARLINLFGIDSARIIVVGNGVDVRFFSTRVGPPIGHNGAPYAIVVGGTRISKGGEHVIAAAERLRQIGSPLQIIVAGSPNPEWLVQRANNLGNVHFLGKLSDSELRSWLQYASNLLFLSEYEGFGMPPLEAMAAGIPVVASRRAAIPEVVSDAGLLVDPSNVEETVDAMSRLHDSAPLRSELISRGHLRTRLYDWDAVADKVFSALCSVY